MVRCTQLMSILRDGYTRPDVHARAALVGEGSSGRSCADRALRAFGDVEIERSGS
jgi:hypothetical protein